MHQYKGRLIIHTGSMFSGKTSSLEKDMKRFKIAGYRTVAFKPSVDIRVNNNEIRTHDNIKLNGVIINDIYEILNYWNEKQPEVMAIDEIQFLGGEINDIVRIINSFLENDVTIVLAGLDMDFTGKPFEVVKELMPFADYLYKHHAVCSKCGTDAWISNRKTKKQDRIVIGSSEEYEPLCRNCFLKEQNRKDSEKNGD